MLHQINAHAIKWCGIARKHHRVINTPFRKYSKKTFYINVIKLLYILFYVFDI